MSSVVSSSLAGMDQLADIQYFIIFLTADTISLILQAVGGAQASKSAATSIPTQSATDIMVAGIIFQLIAMVIFMALGVDFVVRRTIKKPYAFQARRIAKTAATNSGEKVSENSRTWFKRNNGHLGSNVSTANTLVGSNSNGSITASKPTAVDSEASVTAFQSANGGMSEKQLQRRWWMFLLGVGISSLMVIVRGEFVSRSRSFGRARKVTERSVLDGLVTCQTIPS